MSSKQTDNLNLHAWVRTDVFSMQEFNENFDAIDKAVAGKAEKSALDMLTGRVDKKAEQSALDAETAARKTALDALTGRVDKKAEQSDLAAEIAARKADIARVDSALAGQFVFKYDSYKGAGGFGAKAPNRLTFDFKPLVLIVGINPAYSTSGGYPWVRGSTYCKSAYNDYVAVTWENNAVSWYHDNDASRQLNTTLAYYYFVIGIKE